MNDTTTTNVPPAPAAPEYLSDKITSLAQLVQVYAATRAPDGEVSSFIDRVSSVVLVGADGNIRRGVVAPVIIGYAHPNADEPAAIAPVHLNSLPRADRWWYMREILRVQRGVYRSSEVLDYLRDDAYGTTPRHHFIHVSADGGDMIAFTPDDRHGQEDRQVKMRLGRYLEKFSDLRQPQIADLVAMHNAYMDQSFELVEGPEILEKYRECHGTGIKSCMTHPADHWAKTEGHHPIECYTRPEFGWKLAFMRTPAGGMRARALVWHNPEDPTDLRRTRVYGTSQLARRLSAAGYRDIPLFGARIPQIVLPREPGSLMPYIDSPTNNSGPRYALALKTPATGPGAGTPVFEILSDDEREDVYNRCKLEGVSPSSFVTSADSQYGVVGVWKPLWPGFGDRVCAHRGVRVGANVQLLLALRSVHDERPVRISATAVREATQPYVWLVRAEPGNAVKGYVLPASEIDSDNMFNLETVIKQLPARTPDERSAVLTAAVLIRSAVNLAGVPDSAVYLWAPPGDTRPAAVGLRRLDPELYPRDPLAAFNDAALVRHPARNTTVVVRRADCETVAYRHPYPGGELVHRAHVPAGAVRVQDVDGVKAWAMPDQIERTVTGRKVVPGVHRVRQLTDGRWAANMSTVQRTAFGFDDVVLTSEVGDGFPDFSRVDVVELRDTAMRVIEGNFASADPGLSVESLVLAFHCYWDEECTDYRSGLLDVSSGQTVVARNYNVRQGEKDRFVRWLLDAPATSASEFDALIRAVFPASNPSDVAGASRRAAALKALAVVLRPHMADINLIRAAADVLGRAASWGLPVVVRRPGEPPHAGFVVEGSVDAGEASFTLRACDRTIRDHAFEHARCVGAELPQFRDFAGASAGGSTFLRGVQMHELEAALEDGVGPVVVFAGGRVFGGVDAADVWARTGMLVGCQLVSDAYPSQFGEVRDRIRGGTGLIVHEVVAYAATGVSTRQVQLVVVSTPGKMSDMFAVPVEFLWWFPEEFVCDTGFYVPPPLPAVAPAEPAGG